LTEEVVMSAKVEEVGAGAAGAVESPPAAPVAERREEDPRARLAELAAEVVRTQNRRALMEYLRARRGRG
jgi:hypothetical protein